MTLGAENTSKWRLVTQELYREQKVILPMVRTSSYALILVAMCIAVSGCMGVWQSKQADREHIGVNEIYIKNENSTGHEVTVFLNVSPAVSETKSVKLNGTNDRKQEGIDGEVWDVDGINTTQNITLVVFVDGEKEQSTNVREISEDCKNQSIIVEITREGRVAILKSSPCGKPFS